MRTKLVMTVMMALSFGATAQAATHWNGGGDGLRWDDAANWDMGLPVTDERTFVDVSGTTILIDSATTAVSGRLLLADAVGSTNITINMTGGTLTTNDTSSGERNWHLGAQGTATFNQTGGVVTVNGQVNFGVDSVATAQGILTIDGGTFNATGPLVMGIGVASTQTQQLNMISGSLTASRLFVDDDIASIGGPMAVVNMTGGTITVGDLAIPTNYGRNGLNGHFQFDGGIVTVNNASTGGKQNQPAGFRLANGPGDGTQSGNIVTGTMDIMGGTLLLMGDASTLIQGYIDGGALTGFGSPVNVVYDYNNTNVGFTTVKAMLGGTTDTTWTGSGDGVNWTSAGNWNAGVPTALVAAHINGSPNVQVGVGVNAAAVKLALAEGASTDNTTLNVNGGTLNVGGTNAVLIGAKGHATLNLSNAAIVNTGPLQLGANNGEASAQGTVSVANSTLAVNGGIRMGVGDSTAQVQQLTVSGTSNVTAGGLTIGEQAASIAQATLSGGTLAVSGATNLSNGQGTLQITGGNMTSGSLIIAEQAGSVAQVNVSGGTLAVTGTGTTNLGGAGNGTLQITGGAAVILGGNLNMGATGGAASAKGTLTINGGSLSLSGANRTLLMGGSTSTTEVQTLNMVSGSLTAGRLFVDDNTPSGGGPMAVVNMTGGTMTLGDLAIPTNWGLNGLNGHFDLDGGIVIVNNASTGSTGNSPSGFRLANGLDPVQMLNTVTGTMDITSGALLLAGDRGTLVQSYIDSGVLTGSAGAILYDYDVTNIGYTTVHTAAFSGNISTTWTGGGDGLNWQDASNWNNGVPTTMSIAAINGGSTAQVAATINGVVSTLLLGNGAGTDNTTLNVNGGTLTTGGNLSLGTRGHATLNVTNSSTVSVGGEMALGVNNGEASARGTVSVNSGALNVSGGIRLGVGDATTQMQELNLISGTVSGASLSIGETAGTNGKVAVSGGTMTISGPARIGVAGQGTLEVSGLGNAALGATNIGDTGSGTLEVTGGTTSITGATTVGTAASGAVKVSGGAALTLAGATNIGAKNVGTLEITTGGTVHIMGSGGSGRLRVGGVTPASAPGDPGDPSAQGTVTINGGSLQVDERILLGAARHAAATQTLNLTSGSLTATSLFVADEADAVAVVNMSGGTMTVANLGVPTNMGEPNLNGTFNLHGGVVTVTGTSTGGTGGAPSGFRLLNGLDPVGMVNTVSGKMDVTFGTLVLSGDALAIVNPYIVTDKSLLAFGGTGIVVRDFDTTNPGSTTVSASILGDANRDGVVNIFDITLISSNWETGGPTADVNGDSVVNIFDINAVSAHWLQTNPDGPTAGLAAANAVPEPASVITLAIGALLLVARFRGKLRLR